MHSTVYLQLTSVSVWKKNTSALSWV